MLVLLTALQCWTMYDQHGMLYRHTWGGAATAEDQALWKASDCDRKRYDHLRDMINHCQEPIHADREDSTPVDGYHALTCSCGAPSLPCGHQTVSCKVICNQWLYPPPTWTFRHAVAHNGVLYVHESRLPPLTHADVFPSLLRQGPPPVPCKHRIERAFFHSPLLMDNWAHTFKDNVLSVFWRNVTHLVLYDAYRSPPSWVWGLVTRRFRRIEGIPNATCFDDIQWMDRLHYGTFLFPRQHYYHRIGLVPTLARWLLDRTARNGTHHYPIVYVHRPGDRREMYNAHELANALGAVLLTDTNIHAFAEARVIVGTHGAGLTNMMFARPGALVVELTNWRLGESWWFGTLAMWSRHRYLRLHMNKHCKLTRHGYVCSASVIERMVKAIALASDDRNVSGDYCQSPAMHPRCQEDLNSELVMTP